MAMLKVDMEFTPLSCTGDGCTGDGSAINKDCSIMQVFVISQVSRSQRSNVAHLVVL